MPPKRQQQHCKKIRHDILELALQSPPPADMQDVEDLGRPSQQQTGPADLHCPCDTITSQLHAFTLSHGSPSRLHGTSAPAGTTAQDNAQKQEESILPNQNHTNHEPKSGPWRIAKRGPSKKGPMQPSTAPAAVRISAHAGAAAQDNAQRQEQSIVSNQNRANLEPAAGPWRPVNRDPAIKNPLEPSTAPAIEPSPHQFVHPQQNEGYDSSSDDSDQQLPRSYREDDDYMREYFLHYALDLVEKDSEKNKFIRTAIGRKARSASSGQPRKSVNERELEAVAIALEELSESPDLIDLTMIFDHINEKTKVRVNDEDGDLVATAEVVSDGGGYLQAVGEWVPENMVLLRGVAVVNDDLISSKRFRLPPQPPTCDQISYIDEFRSDRSEYLMVERRFVEEDD